jgi:hypothetical protein
VKLPEDIYLGFGVCGSLGTKCVFNNFANYAGNSTEK